MSCREKILCLIQTCTKQLTMDSFDSFENVPHERGTNFLCLLSICFLVVALSLFFSNLQARLKRNRRHCHERLILKGSAL